RPSARQRGAEEERAVGKGQRRRGEQPGARAAMGAPIDKPALQVWIEPLERAAPVAGGAAEFEHRLRRPYRHRGVARRLLGEAERRGMVLAPLRLDEEAVQAEHAGVVALRHLLEGGDGAVAIAVELRALRADQQGERP